MDDGFIGGDKELLIKQVVCSLIIYIIIAMIDVVKEKKRVDIAANIQYCLSEQSFKHLMRIKTDYFSNKNYAEILNNINMDIGSVYEFYSQFQYLFISQKYPLLSLSLKQIHGSYRNYIVYFYYFIRFNIMLDK